VKNQSTFLPEFAEAGGAGIARLRTIHLCGRTSGIYPGKRLTKDGGEYYPSSRSVNETVSTPPTQIVNEPKKIAESLSDFLNDFRLFLINLLLRGNAIEMHDGLDVVRLREHVEGDNRG